MSAALASLSLPVVAHAGTIGTNRSSPPPASIGMELAQLAMPPAGFLAFCRRNPEECGRAASTTTEDPAIVAAISTRIERLQMLRQADDRSVTAASQASPHTDWFASDIVASRPSGWATGRWEMFVPRPQVLAVDGTVRIDITATISQLRKHVAPASEAAVVRDTKLDLTPELWAQVDRLNRQVNRAIVFRSDTDNFGVKEVWSLPLAEGRNTGDCEDYVLEKRHALLAAGIPSSALSIAVVVTMRGEGHAVLLLNTDKGEYVLDSLSNKIQPWAKTGYEWRQRQVAGSASRWAMVANGGMPAKSRDHKPSFLLAALN